MCNCSKKEESSQINHFVDLSSGKSHFVDLTLRKSHLGDLTSAKSHFGAAIYKYIGKTALTLIGVHTQRRYRFEKPGDVQMIESNDIEGIIGIPVLERI